MFSKNKKISSLLVGTALVGMAASNANSISFKKIAKSVLPYPMKVVGALLSTVGTCSAMLMAAMARAGVTLKEDIRSIAFELALLASIPVGVYLIYLAEEMKNDSKSSSYKKNKYIEKNDKVKNSKKEKIEENQENDSKTGNKEKEKIDEWGKTKTEKTVLSKG